MYHIRCSNIAKPSDNFCSGKLQSSHDINIGTKWKYRHIIFINRGARYQYLVNWIMYVYIYEVNDSFENGCKNLSLKVR